MPLLRETTVAHFSLLLTQNPFASQSFDSALQFAKAALAAGYSIEQVFLYEDAVFAAAATINLPTDERSLAAELAKFCQQQ